MEFEEHEDKQLRSVEMLNATAILQAREQAERALLEANDRVTRILESITDGFIVLDRDWRFTYVNSQAEEIVRPLGKSREQLLGKSIWTEFSSLAGTEVERHYRRAMADQVKVDFEFFYPLLNSWFEIRVYPGREGLSIYFQDITQRKRAERKVTESVERLHLALDAGHLGDWSWEAESDEVFLGDRAAAVFGLEPSGRVTWARLRELLHEEDRELARVAVEKALMEGSDYSIEYRIRLPSGGLRWIMARGRGRYGEDGTAIGMVGVVQDVTQRKSAEVERDRLTNILERSLNEIYIFDTQTLRFEYVNEGARRNLGYSLEEMRWKTPTDIKPEFSEVRFREMIKPLLSGEKEKHVFYTIHRRRDGTDYPVEVHLQPVSYAGQRVFLAVILDITERKKAEEALLESEDRFRTAVTDAAIGVAITTINGAFVQVNAAYTAITGYSEEELAGMNFREVIHPEDIDENIRLIEELVEGRRSGVVITNRYLRRDGATMWVQKSVSVVRDSRGKALRIIVFVEDINQRKETEERLRRSEEELRALADSIPQLAWMANPDGHIFWYNRGWYDYTGTSFEEMEGWGWKTVHDPAILPSVMERWEESIRTGTEFEMEFPLRGSDGQFRWFLTRVNPVRDREGRVVRWFGTNTNMDEVRRAREALREETRVLELLNDTGRSIASKLDLQSLVQTVTDSATQLTGAKFGAFFYNVMNDQGESFVLFTLTGAPREAFERFGLPRNTPVFNPTFRGEGVVRSSDITRDWRYGKVAPHHGMPKGHLPVRSYLAVPVISRSGEVIGGLFFGHPETDIFTERAERLAVGVAAQAAIAIDNARLYDAAQREISERRRAEEALARRIRLTALRAEISAALARNDELRTILQRCAEVLVKGVDGAFARIWTLDEGGILELQTSAGMYTNLDGRHSRIRLGQFKIGRIAESRQPLLTNDIQNDGSISDPDWARAQGMVAFAGYPLMVETRVVGVVGLFARHELPDDVLKEVSLIADGLAQWIQRKQAEQALREAQEKLSLHAENLERQVAERTASLRETIGELEAFSYSISHDMRAPLRAMQSFAHILGEEYGPQVGMEGKEYIRKITTAAERLDRLIQDVLSYSRVTRIELPMEVVDLNSLLADIVQTYPAFQRPKAEIEVESELPKVLGNQAVLTQCISNLLDNGVKFVARGKMPRVVVWAELDSNKPLVRIYFRDNGVGIEEEQREAIFGIFQRVSRDYEGTGIGLAIVRKGVERMGGSVGLRSAVGEGSTFWLELKAAAAAK